MRERLPRSPEEPYDGYVFDLDGTIYLGDELLPGAGRLILELRELGLETPAEEIVNTVVSMTGWFLQNRPDATVFPIAEEPLKNALREAGIKIFEDPEEVLEGRVDDARICVTPAPANATDTKTPKSRPSSN